MQNTSNTIQAYIHGSTYDTNGVASCCFTVGVDVKIKRTWWQDKSLSYTATGYGKRIPTQYMVKFNGKWRRVYCRIYSNNGTLYIGRLNEHGERLIVQINAD